MFKVEVHRQKYLEVCKRFAQNSLKLNADKDKKTDEFEQVAIEMCDFFIEDTTVMKQQIPNGLSQQEIACIQRVAAARGLSITKQTRYDVESMFLTKKSYYAKDSM